MFALLLLRQSVRFWSRLPSVGSVTTSCCTLLAKQKSNMSRDYVREISVLSRKNVHIKDKQAVNRLLDQIINGGANSLQAVFDFDRTITKQHEDGKEFLSSFALFRHCPSTTKEFVETSEKLKTTYYPIEIGPSYTIEEKKKKMEEWWRQSLDSMKGLKVSKEEIDDAVNKYVPSPRDGTRELFADLNKNEVPVLVFSAGIGDVVASALRYFGVLYPTVKVVSNFLKYNEKGEIQGFIGKTIDVFSKNEYALEGTEYFKLIEKRENVILLGDSIGDAGMADGMPHCNAVLKIGFLYDHINENLPKYKEVFDIVLEDDQTMDVVRGILKYVL